MNYEYALWLQLHDNIPNFVDMLNVWFLFLFFKE